MLPSVQNFALSRAKKFIFDRPVHVLKANFPRLKNQQYIFRSPAPQSRHD